MMLHCVPKTNQSHQLIANLLFMLPCRKEYRSHNSLEFRCLGQFATACTEHITQLGFIRLKEHSGGDDIPKAVQLSVEYIRANGLYPILKFVSVLQSFIC